MVPTHGQFVDDPDSDVTDCDRNVGANPRIKNSENLPSIAAPDLSVSCDSTKGVVMGWLIAAINEPITDHHSFKAAAELFHRSVEAARAS